VARRPNLLLDKQLDDKLAYYRLIARFYRIKLINTEDKTVDNCVDQVMLHAFE